MFGSSCTIGTFSNPATLSVSVIHLSVGPSTASRSAVFAQSSINANTVASPATWNA